MTLFFQRLVDGLADGSVYGFTALALVLVFRASKLINFAQGEMAMFSAFIVWYLANSPNGPGLAIGWAIVGGIVFGALLGAGLSRFVMRPFQGGDHLREVMVTMGLFLVISTVAAWIFTTNPQRLDSPFPPGGLQLGAVVVSYHRLGTFLSLLVVTGLLALLLSRTRTGLALRAAASNPESARLLGINVGRTQVIGWAIAAGLGALAGALLAPSLFVSTSMMSTVLLYGFAAAALGGFDSIGGALLGGMIIGLVQQMAGGYLPFVGTELQLAVALVLIVVVLLVRPQGLFGSSRVERV
ncbi:branched-chain amino acid ABC transporter permease [Pseudonocardia sp. RS010]|uniref:branched-chain amino acid ABC transporter permease n=1 Tax=Pseudonocardia sp. RS010 TaxID=3385979 RepID=UPI0039A3E673